MAVKITCVKMDNGFHESQYTAITDLGWINEETQKSGLSTRLQIYEYIKGGGHVYISGNSGERVMLVAAETPKGIKYVKSINESGPDNLLNLAPCK